ncbi:MAG: chromosomal replication initiator protein DnaA [Lachnospirales bacterium]
MNTNDATFLWNETLKKLDKEHKISDVFLEVYFKNIEPINIDNNILKLFAEKKSDKDYIIHRKKDVVLSAIRELNSNILDFEISTELDSKSSSDSLSTESIDYIDIEQAKKRANLQTHYTFEHFVKGDCNDYAFNISKVVANEPGMMENNPLFFYGGVGLGKTHLMQAIGNRVLEHNTSKKVLYTSFDTFFNEYTDSLSAKDSASFRQKYSELNVLLIDDIQFIAKKEKAQDEIFHIFEYLRNSNVQIVFTSDKPPKEIENLTDRLSSRFSNCMIDITNPDLETRIAIIKNKANIKNVAFENNIIDFIAENVTTNVRELEAAFNKVVQFEKFTDKKVNIEMVKEILTPYIQKDNKKALTVEFIIEITAGYFDCSIEDILSKKRSAKIVYPRQIAMYLSRKLTSESLPNIGEKFNRDHSTVIAAISKIDDNIKNKQGTMQFLVDLENKIKGS